MQPFLNKLSSFCLRGIYGFLVPGLACVFLSGCAGLAPSRPDAALEAARVKLMEGAITRDQSVIQPLLAPDFTWREDNAPLDEEPYDFWNRHRLWKEFGALLKQQPVAKSNLMIAPKDAASDGYRGPRVAWRKVGGEWKLAYFYASMEGSH